MKHIETRMYNYSGPHLLQAPPTLTTESFNIISCIDQNYRTSIWQKSHVTQIHMDGQIQGKQLDVQLRKQ